MVFSQAKVTEGVFGKFFGFLPFLKRPASAASVIAGEFQPFLMRYVAVAYVIIALIVALGVVEAELGKTVPAAALISTAVILFVICTGLLTYGKRKAIDEMLFEPEKEIDMKLKALPDKLPALSENERSILGGAKPEWFWQRWWTWPSLDTVREKERKIRAAEEEHAKLVKQKTAEKLRLVEKYANAYKANFMRRGFKKRFTWKEMATFRQYVKDLDQLKPKATEDVPAILQQFGGDAAKTQKYIRKTLERAHGVLEHAKAKGRLPPGGTE